MYRLLKRVLPSYAARVVVCLSLVIGLACVRHARFLDSDPQLFFILFYPLVLLSAWLGGFSLGSLTAAASVATLAHYFYVHTTASVSDVETTLFALLAEGIAMSFLFDRLIKRIEREHRRRLHTMQTFINEAPAAIAMFDLDMRYLAVSKRWIADFQLEDQELLGRAHYEVFPEIPTRWKEVHKRCLAGAVERADSDLFVRSDGTQQWLSWEVRPWFEECGRGAIGGILMFSEDITEMKEASERESELRAKAYIDSKLRIEAERASKQKDDFVATLSHELRTPLNAMLGWTQLLQRVRDDPGRLSQALSAIERSGGVLAQLISDILDINRISLGKLKLTIESVPVESLIQSAFDTALPQAEANNITLEKDIFALGVSVSGTSVVGTSVSGTSVRGDPVRLQQCLWNLLSNAIRFTPSGGRVVISASAKDDLVQIAVRDTGQGIRPEQLPRLFDQFMQADSSSTRPHHGLGLGLAIVRQLVELHGGTVAAESAGIGRGTIFTIALPREDSGALQHPVTGEQDISTAEPQMSNRLFLVVDDEMEAREFLRGVIESYGAQVYTAASVANGIAIARRCPVDLIISDIAMPERDGCDLIRDVRAAGITTPAIALSAYTDPANVDRACHAGFDRCLAKPVKLEALVSCVRELLEQKRDLPKAS